MISILLITLLSNLNCEDFCVNPCSVLNGNYTNECSGCPAIYNCNPNFSNFYTVKWSNYENESNVKLESELESELESSFNPDLESNPRLESDSDLESDPILESDSILESDLDLESDSDLIQYSFWNITKYLKYLEA